MVSDIKNNENNSKNSKRIAKNTIFLYFRMLLTLGVSLYTSRVVLNTLGVTDFGIYSVVGTVVTMFTMISGSLSSATSRFLTFELGREDLDKLKKVFSTSVSIHIFLAIFILIVGEIVGIWYLHNKMVIPPERVSAAFWTFQCSIIAFAINLISIPYNASIVAHEKMDAFAYISIVEVVLKLAVVFLLLAIPFDKLVVYAVLLVIVALIIRVIYTIYCRKNFEECHYSFVFDKSMFKEIGCFAGWNMIGASSSILKSEGTNILINAFSGLAVNAARAISFQVNSAITQFTQNFMIAVNPQITKSYASENRNYMMDLIFQSSRFSFYMLLFLSMPVLLDTNYILSLWLKIVPEHTVNFVRLILIYSMIEVISGPLVTTMLATGKIRNYQIVVGGLQMMNFPASWIFLKLGYPPEITIILFIFFSVCCLSARLVMLRKMVQFPVKRFIKNVILKLLFVSVLSVFVPILLYMNIDCKDFIGFIKIGFTCLLSTSFFIYFIGLSSKERIYVSNKIPEIFSNLFSRKK